MTIKSVSRCGADNCSQGKVLARGLCRKHYQRWRKWGDPNYTSICRGDDENFVQLFWQQANVKSNPDKCWEWQKATDKDGYGKILLHKKDVRTHRVAYELFYEEPIGDLLVCHTCDNPLCINPHHLWLGTVQDNNRDKWEKGHYDPSYRIK